MPNFRILCLTALAALPLCAWEATRHFDFTGSHTLKPYPAAVAGSLSKNQDGYLLHKNPELEKACVYFNLAIPPEAKAMKYAFTYKNTDGAVPQLTVSFNVKDGGNGSNGMKKITFPNSPDWRTHEVLISIPNGTATIQCTHAAIAHAYELALKTVDITFLSDTFAITAAPPGFSPTVPPSQWQNVALLPGFHICVTAEPAAEQTDLKLTFDQQNLYVGFLAQISSRQALVAKVEDKGPDAAVFRDDCLELFLSAPERNLAWRFAANSNGSRFDGEIRQRVPGDPWKTQGDWNGDWTVTNFLEDNLWQAVFTIPWKTLDFAGIPQNPLGFNAGRENKASAENSQWNAYDGNFHAVDKYAVLDLANGTIERTRRADRASFIVNRLNPQFEAVLTQEPGNFRTGTWGTALLREFPEKIRQLYSAEEELAWQDTLLAARGDAGMLGPPLPWANRNLIGGWEKMRQLHEQFGTKFPYYLSNSAVTRMAIEAGAKYHYGKTAIDPACEGYREFVVNRLEELKTKPYYPQYLEHVGLVFGIDEPTNSVRNVYSRMRNPALATALDDADAEIKATTGFGRFGLYDGFAEPTPNIEFERIAFWRWWSANFARYCREVQAKVREVFPGVDFKSTNRNTVSGVCPMDVALLSPYSDWISCDPYPTSTAASYGLGRALYHPGFSAKMLGDLAAQAKLCATPQNFIYRGGRPRPEEMREWASQCLKVGAKMLYWYVEGPNTLMNMWDGNLEALSINKQLKTLPRLDIPTKTVSAILHSDYDRWGRWDDVLHPTYSLYTLLGEQAKAWFEFISPTGLATGIHNLDRYQILYIPRMKFTDPATTAALTAFVNRGGVLVVFDPDFLLYNIDGSPVPERTTLLGTALTPKEIKNPAIVYDDKKLPLYKVANMPGSDNGRCQAFDFVSLPADSRVLATYADDGRPALLERSIGQGRIIFSAAQPFGNSDVALQPTAWVDFFQALCQSVGEPTGLPIWDFVLKKSPEHQVELNLTTKW
jgi:hypothetical protein